jgi:hypothetical protein
MCPIRYFGQKFSKPSLSRYSLYRKARLASRPFGPARRARYKSGQSQTYIHFKGLLSPFCLKQKINKKTFFCWILSRMVENGLTKKINPNTNIWNSVITAIQTFKELLCTVKRQTAHAQYITARCTEWDRKKDRSTSLNTVFRYIPDKALEW